MTSDINLVNRIILLEQRIDITTKEFNKVLGDIEQTVTLLTKGTTEALKSMKKDLVHVEAAMENLYFQVNPDVDDAEEEMREQLK